MGAAAAAALIGVAKVVVGPVSAAFAGAWAAQKIAKRNADQQRRLEELRATNAAISTTLSILNASGALKRQHVLPMKTLYEKQRQDLSLVEAGFGEKTFSFTADFKTLVLPAVATPVLEKLLYDRVSAPPGAMGLFAFLMQSVSNLSSMLEQRNSLIADIKGSNDPKEVGPIYFGTRDSRGHVDTRYFDCMEAMQLYTDDTILFSYFLIRELSAHATRLATPKVRGFPPPTRVNFAELKSSGILPDVGQKERQLLRSLGVEPDASMIGSDAAA